LTGVQMHDVSLRILHCLNEINLRNQWHDNDQFSIRLARHIAGENMPQNEHQLLSQVQKVRTHFFQANRVSKKRYTEYVWPYAVQVLGSVRTSQQSQERNPIGSEEALFQVVVSILGEYGQVIENTRLWQPFWNEQDGRPWQPKLERSLQPTIFNELRPRFRHVGVELLREPNDGAGPLDFRCTTTCEHSVFNCCIEFKRAQHHQLERRIQTQLPAYMDAVDTRHGVFFVFWFKDGATCKDPTKYSSPIALKSSLSEASRLAAPRTIEVIVVDVTPEPSASRKKPR